MPRRNLTALALILLILSLACSTLIGPRAEPDRGPTSGIATVAPDDTPSAAVPQPTAAPDADPIRLTAEGFAQQGTDLGAGFLIENPNADVAFTYPEYQIAAYDEAGAVLGTEHGVVELILPGQSLGVGERITLEEGMVADRIDVQLLQGDPLLGGRLPAVHADRVVRFRTARRDSVTGVVHNPYDVPLTDIRVTALLMRGAADGAADILGGGFTYVSFIPPQGTTGVRVLVTADEGPADAHLYPITPHEVLPDDARDDAGSSPRVEPLIMEGAGFAQDGREVAYGIVVRNPNAEQLIETSRYHVTAYGADDRVLGTDEGYLKQLLRAQTLGIAGRLYAADDLPVARIEAQLLTGKPIAAEPRRPFATESAAYHPGDYRPFVTGEVVSPYYGDVTDVRVSAILYDAGGTIIGSGFTYLDFVPGGGKAAVEVTVINSEPPAEVVLFATLSSLSQFQE